MCSGKRKRCNSTPREHFINRFEETYICMLRNNAVYTYIYIYIYIHISMCISRTTFQVARPRERKDEAKVETEYGVCVCKVILTVLPANGVQTACYYFIERGRREWFNRYVSSLSDTLCFEGGIKQGELKEGRGCLVSKCAHARWLSLLVLFAIFFFHDETGRKGERESLERNWPQAKALFSREWEWGKERGKQRGGRVTDWERERERGGGGAEETGLVVQMNI